MGAVDTEGKQYMSNAEYFADAFNYLLHDGKVVIKAEELKESIPGSFLLGQFENPADHLDIGDPKRWEYH